MNAAFEEIESELAALIAEFGRPITIAGRRVDAFVGTATKSTDHGQGYSLEDSRIQIVVSKFEAGAIDYRTTVIVDETYYSPETINDVGSILEIDLIRANR